MSLYNTLCGKEIKSTSANKLAIRRANDYKKSNPTKGIGKSETSKPKMSKEIKNMSVWD